MEYSMETRHPNRERGQTTGSEEVRRKQSGDQHIDPPNDGDDVNSQPHRMNRDTRHNDVPEDRSSPPSNPK
jgi:hypothetical protein